MTTSMKGMNWENMAFTEGRVRASAKRFASTLTWRSRSARGGAYRKQRRRAPTYRKFYVGRDMEMAVARGPQPSMPRSIVYDWKGSFRRIKRKPTSPVPTSARVAGSTVGVTAPDVG